MPPMVAPRMKASFRGTSSSVRRLISIRKGYAGIMPTGRRLLSTVNS